MDADRSQEHEDKGRVAKSFRRLSMFGKICKLQFFMLALIVCGPSCPVPVEPVVVSSFCTRIVPRLSA